MLSIGKVYKGEVCYYTPHANMYSAGGDARWGCMLSIRERMQGKYVIIPRTQICIVLEGMQDGGVCLALGSV